MSELRRPMVALLLLVSLLTGGCCMFGSNSNPDPYGYSGPQPEQKSWFQSMFGPPDPPKPKSVPDFLAQPRPEL